MIPEKVIAIDVKDEVVSFVRNNIESLGMKDPVPLLIYGRFEDEEQDHFRVSLSERDELQIHAKDKGFITPVRGLGELFVPSKYESMVKDKVMKLVGDTVEFE